MTDTMLIKPAALAASLAFGVATVGGVAIYAMNSASSSPSNAPTTSTFTGGSGTINTAPNAAGGNGNGNGNNGNGGGNAGHPISVTWTIDAPLQPGRVGTLAARITNQNNQAINVQSVSAVVNSASKPGCDKAWLTVGSFSGSQPVAANSFAVVNLSIQLLDKTLNQDACKGAKFNLTVSGTAVQA